MLYFKRGENGKVIDVADRFKFEERLEWFARHEMKTFAMALSIAAEATEAKGRLYIAVDKGQHTWPRYDVVEAPVVGDAVSYSFNGDTYPDGYITHVTNGTLKVVKTDSGSTYYRRGNSGSWVKQGGTWSMVKGHITEQNPHF